MSGSFEPDSRTTAAMYCSIARYDWSRLSLLALDDGVWTVRHKNTHSIHQCRELRASGKKPAAIARVRDMSLPTDHQMRAWQPCGFDAQLPSRPIPGCLLSPHTTIVHPFRGSGAQPMALW